MYIPIWAMLPFILLLLAIAIMPLFAEHIWEKNKNKLIVALVLAIPTAIWLILNGLFHHLQLSIVYDYIPFIIMLGALFVITGGIYIEGNIEAKPITNVTFLAIGAVLASFMGTTGAAMLLIRPLINTNKERRFKTHTILFFIAVVANCGGLLTPLGDPPLFMMYLRGVRFEWFSQLWLEWFVANGLILLVYYIWDSIVWKKENNISRLVDKKRVLKIKIHGKINFLFLAGIVLAVAFINPNTMSFIQANTISSYTRELFIALMAVLSLIFTTKQVRESNNFNWEPIQEVAYLFFGIFITMVPCLLFLETNANSLGINSPSLFYYATGALSSFLDNTPTAVTFYSLALGLVEQNPNIANGMTMVAGIPEIFMKAICVSAVIFGSMTYIGNGPNFMVKAIAESEGIKMPSFFGYIFKFSLIVLLPIYIIVELVLFSL